MMNLYSIIFGGNDSYLRGREAVVADPLDKQITTTHIVPEKFRDDIAALTEYIGVEKFKSGLTIEVSLAELLGIVLRPYYRGVDFTNFAKDLVKQDIEGTS